MGMSGTSIPEILDSSDALVSIITPAFNSARYVDATISSVRAQSYENWEMLIVDDCSSDNTVEIVERASALDPRVRLIRQLHNGGPAAARNSALMAARGRWIAFLDSDDLWLPQKLELQLAFQLSHSAKITFTAFRRISADGQTTGRLINIPDRVSYQQLLGNTVIATSTVIIDREIAGEFRMKATYYDDFGCWLDMLRGGDAALGLQYDLMRYRVVSQSVSRNKRNSARQVWRTYRTVEGIGLLRAAWHFVNYAVNGYLKHRRF
jgi:teichuronic acid biosynthesis glycosyltransferase TuaG